MTLAAVPLEVFTELARTRPLPEATAALRAALHARRMLLVKSLLVRFEQRRALLAPEVGRRFEQGWALLERAERSDPAAVRDVVDYPMTGAWLTETLAAPVGPAFERHLAHLGGVAVAAAVRAGCQVGGTLTQSSGSLVLPGLGVLHCPSGSARLRGRGGLVRITDGAGGSEVILPRPTARGESGTRRPVGSGPGWSALRTLPGSTVVLDDLDPYRVPRRGIGPAALPAADRPHSDHRPWARIWHEAHTLLSATDPGRAAETSAVLRAVVPLVSPVGDGGITMSATLRSSPGAVLTQLPADASELAESLVHESHHTKLAALHEFVPLYRPGGGTLHRVAWRLDPRPVPGVLQGAYAHLALTDLWWRARTGPVTPDAWRRKATQQFETYREQVGEALSILLESDELTFAGREFVHEMSRHHASLGVATRNPG
ncbi:HEXXH motif-containing putative peptide modification protein [Streptomyces sp. ActVer]|uniref:aKG-HExxH-type peptide beta-hydroxylase n=1 Tax=Streptomyces sp. ActVer TaxID=3014558 RepID=UPI0022B3572A|nr:HEXXH motif-containing putative peptide modification protein [Streptomyces sp. ActVer]MCZ4514868.1 HEXXH motif-containing putative peptide modification protein [Streptomyces sp. ActVer]